jgi:hypothetical protein
MGYKNPPVETQFKKGDKRINRLGRPKSFDQLRKLAQSIATEVVETKQGEKITVVDAIMRTWAKSKDPRLVQAFIAYAYGKPPDIIQGDQKGGPVTLLVKYDQKDKPNA